MKLIDLVKDTIKVWPTGWVRPVNYIVQSKLHDGQLLGFDKKPSNNGHEGVWGSRGGASWFDYEDIRQREFVEDWETAIVTKAEWVLATMEDKVEKKTKTNDGKSEWIRHRGGKQPVATLGHGVLVRLRNGRRCYNDADSFTWSHDRLISGGEIMEYFIAKDFQALDGLWDVIDNFPIELLLTDGSKVKSYAGDKSPDTAVAFRVLEPVVRRQVSQEELPPENKIEDLAETILDMRNTYRLLETKKKNILKVSGEAVQAIDEAMEVIARSMANEGLQIIPTDLVGAVE